MLATTLPDSNSPIRQGTTNDMDALIGICRDSFPDALRWQSIRFLAQRWWSVALNSYFGETWILQTKGQVSGVCVLVIDEVGWAEEKTLRCLHRPVQLLISLMYPHLLATYVRKRREMTRIGLENSIPLEPDSFAKKKRTWIELLAVSSTKRRSGVGRKLLHLCELRTKQIGRSSIGLCVHPRNSAALNFYKACNFKLISITKGGYICGKTIDIGDGKTCSHADNRNG